MSQQTEQNTNQLASAEIPNVPVAPSTARIGKLLASGEGRRETRTNKSVSNGVTTQCEHRTRLAVIANSISIYKA